MKIKNRHKILSFILTFMMIMSNFMGLGEFKTAHAETLLVNEGFDNYISSSYTVPVGWIFNLKTAGNYTSSGNYGAKSPSVKFAASGDSITTPTFSNPSQLSFWIKGQNSVGTFVVEGFDGSTWNQIDSIDVSTIKTGTTKTYELASNIVQVKFTYNKTTSNVAFDDVVITGQSQQIAVNSVSLDKTTLSIPVGGSDKLTPIFDPSNASNKNVTWSSSDSNIASVQNSLVTGVTTGSAKIVVTTEDGGKTASCDVTVTPQIHVTGITLNQHEATVNVGKTLTLVSTIEPADATVKTVTWSSSDPTVASVKDGVVTANKEGTATITVTTDDGSFTDNCNIMVSAIPELTIAEARNAAIDEYVAISGVVTFVDSTSGGTNYYTQDNTGAIDVYIPGETTAAHSVGDLIKATGKISTYKGLLEVSSKSADVTTLSGNNPLPEPKVITIADANSEAYESQRVKIQNITIGTVNTSGNTPLTDSSSNLINIYKVPALAGITAGDTVDVIAIVSQYSSATPPSGGYQLRVRDASDITKIQLPDTTPPAIIHTPVAAGNIGEDLEIKATIIDDKGISAAKVYYRTKGDTTYKALDMTATSNVNEYSAVIPKADLSINGLEYYIEAADGTNTSTYPLDKSNPVQVTISSEDITAPEITDLTPASGTYTGKELRPVISAKYTDAAGIDVSSVKLTVDKADVTSKAAVTANGITYTPDADLSEGQHVVTLEVSDISPKKNKEITTWNFYVGELKYNFYFGQLHSHTNLSDGTGTPDDAYTWARDNGKADFFAITDHSNSFDNDTANENISDVSQSTSTKWKQLRETADKYNENGKFVAIGGFEMTWSGSTGGWGHINTFNTPWFVSRNNKNMDLKSYYAKLGQNQDSISQLNHPGTTFGDFSDFGYWTPEADRVVDLVEVGNGEGPVRGSGYFPSYNYYTRALDKGWHVAPSNNQDNHKGGWITANDARTVILASTLTRDSLYEAIRNRRVYATEDKNLRIMYTVNGNVMGSMLNNPGKLNISIDITDPDTTDVIGKVSIIVDGGKIAESKTFDSNTAEWDLTLDSQYNYYYVRVDEADKDIAVTAPVWTGEVVPVGISKVDVSQNPQIVNTPTDITATIYNNSTTPLSNVKVEFFRDSISDTNRIGEQTIASVDASSSGTAKITWTPDTTGNIKIYAQTVINIDGKDRNFTESTSFTVAKAEDITKIVIDGGHQNQYVTGDYPGNVKTLSSMLKDKNIMLVQNPDGLTAEDLQNAKVLILTDPGKTVNYTDEEIKVVQDFINAGGSLIITSRADYNDKGVTDRTLNSAAQGNRVLEAIGSNLRFNDDEVIDNTSNGGQNYRLYFDDYTSTKYNLTDNIVPGYTYSAYSGCSVILKDNGSDEKVDWLVKGHDTTEILDSDLQGDATPVQKGQVNSLAAEILSNGSKIIVAGTTFFSDFETAAVDNAYSNKQIIDNIISWLTAPPSVEVKTIAEVRIDADKDGVPDLLGKKYAVEGRVTAQSVGVGTNNAFFDVIYVQDETGGLTIFGVSQRAIPLGVKVRVTGTVGQYEGDSQIQIKDENTDVEILDSNPAPLMPKDMTTGDTMLEENEGWLVKTQGTVKSINTEGGDNSLYIDDGTGTAKVYVNGYIGDGTGNSDMLGKWDKSIKVGDIVSAVGLASQDASGHRIRVRNTGEIVKVTEFVPVSSIELDRTTAALEKGDTLTLKATIKPKNATNKTVTWTSSNTTVATVDSNGVVIGINAGTADITVKTSDGGFEAICRVTVVRPSSGGRHDSDNHSGTGNQPGTVTQPPAPQQPPAENQTGNGSTPSEETKPVDNTQPKEAVEVTYSESKAEVKLNESALEELLKSTAQTKPSNSSSEAVVQIAPKLTDNIKTVNFELPSAAISKIAENKQTLDINLGSSSIKLPSQVLGTLSKNQNIKLEISLLEKENIKEFKPTQEMKPAGDGISFEIKNEDGSTALFNGKIKLTLKLDSKANPDLAGIYYLDEKTGRLIFMGGKVSDGMIEAETTHNSKYLVLQLDRKFKDVSSSSPYNKYVKSMVAKNIISGYSDGTYRGTNCIARADFIIAMCKAFGIAPTAYKGKFKDIKATDSYAGYIQSLYNMGAIKGSMTGYYRPGGKVTKEEIYTIIGRIVNKPSNVNIKAYKDYKNISSKNLEDVKKAIASKLVISKNGKLYPKYYLNRFEAAELLYKIYNR